MLLSAWRREIQPNVNVTSTKDQQIPTKCIDVLSLRIDFYTHE